MYDNSPRAIYREQGGLTENEALILGGEAAMWSEQVKMRQTFYAWQEMTKLFKDGGSGSI